MEIKVVNKQEGCTKKVHLYEAEDPFHYEVYFQNKKEFVNNYNKETERLSGSVIGVPEELWDGKNPESCEYNGYFLALFYNKGDKLKFLIIMKSKVFITNQGQTIDTIVI